MKKKLENDQNDMCNIKITMKEWTLILVGNRKFSWYTINPTSVIPNVSQQS